jgi:hypothetical protein
MHTDKERRMVQNCLSRSALTPALSPRRGSAADALDHFQSLAAFKILLATNAAKNVMKFVVFVAHPLLGERAGVRASLIKFYLPALGVWIQAFPSVSICVHPWLTQPQLP